jgi:hypothetical protein
MRNVSKRGLPLYADVPGLGKAVELPPGPNNAGFPTDEALRRGRVGLWEGQRVDCWLDPGQRWNGWACPYLTFDQAMAFCERQCRERGQDGGPLRAFYAAERDEFWFMLDDTGEDHERGGEWRMDAAVADGDIPAFMFEKAERWPYATAPTGEELYDFSLGLCWTAE